MRAIRKFGGEAQTSPSSGRGEDASVKTRRGTGRDHRRCAGKAKRLGRTNASGGRGGLLFADIAPRADTWGKNLPKQGFCGRLTGEDTGARATTHLLKLEEPGDLLLRLGCAGEDCDGLGHGEQKRTGGRVRKLYMCGGRIPDNLLIFSQIRDCNLDRTTTTSRLNTSTPYGIPVSPISHTKHHTNSPPHT